MRPPPIPPPLPIAIRILADLLGDDVGDRISTVLEFPMPTVRVSTVGYVGAAAQQWEISPMFQVEVWSDDDIEAEQIAWNLANAWPTSTALQYGNGVVHGRWVSQLPIALPANDDDAEETGYARYMITLTFRLTGVNNG